QMNDTAIIEALLFVAGDDGLSLEELAKLTENPLDVVAAKIENITEKYEVDETSGLKIIETANTYQIVTKREVAEYIKRYAQSPFSQLLSRPLLETLAIIAYKQPITRVEIEEIRGVQVTSNLQKLRSRQLIEEVGRLDKPGKPLLYGTTALFLDYFGINTIDELPTLAVENNDQEMSDLFFKNFQQSFEDIEQENFSNYHHITNKVGKKMERLQKVMAHAGVASRRKSEEIIEQGRVKVNGEVVKELGTKVSKNDTITVDDVLIEREQYVYVLLNKPRETISTTDDPKNRDT